MSSPVESTRYGIQHGATAYNVSADFMSENQHILAKSIPEDRMKRVRKDAASLFAQMIQDKKLKGHIAEAAEIEIVDYKEKNSKKDDTYISINISGKKIKLDTPKELKDTIQRIRNDILFKPGEVSEKTVKGEKIDQPLGNLKITMSAYTTQATIELLRLEAAEKQKPPPIGSQSRTLQRTFQTRRLNEEVKGRLMKKLDESAKATEQDMKSISTAAVELQEAAKAAKDTSTASTAETVSKLSRSGSHDAKKAQLVTSLDAKAYHLDSVGRKSGEIVNTLAKVLGPTDPKLNKALGKTKAASEANSERMDQVLFDLDKMLDDIE